MFVHHINPDEVWNEFVSEFHVIEAAGGVVKNNDGGTLFIFRQGKWDLPKGKLDKGENEHEAALRETGEECGIKELSIINPLAYSYYTYKSGDEAILKKIHWFEMKYKGSEPLSPQLAEGITDARWFADNELEIPLSNTYPSVIDLFIG